MLRTSDNVLAAYPSILYCLGVAVGIAHNILAVTRRTQSTWMGFPSTLLLQLFFVRKIKDRIRTVEASLTGTQLSFLHFTLCPCRCAFLCAMQCLGNAVRLLLCLSHSTQLRRHTAHTSTLCAYDIMQAKANPLLHPPPHTHTHTLPTRV